MQTANFQALRDRKCSTGAGVWDLRETNNRPEQTKPLTLWQTGMMRGPRRSTRLAAVEAGSKQPIAAPNPVTGHMRSVPVLPRMKRVYHEPVTRPDIFSIFSFKIKNKLILQSDRLLSRTCSNGQRGLPPAIRGQHPPFACPDPAAVLPNQPGCRSCLQPSRSNRSQVQQPTPEGPGNRFMPTSIKHPACDPVYHTVQQAGCSSICPERLFRCRAREIRPSAGP